jgi:AcrR family transcriptional regulator
MPRSEPQVATTYRRSLLRQERSRQTRDALVHAALSEWRARGYDDTTVDDISAAAGVARSTYYFHFPDKESLLREIASTSAATIGRAVERSTDAGTSLEDGLRTFGYELARHVERLPPDLVAKVTLSVLGGIGHLGDDDRGGPSFARQLEAVFAANRDELAAEADPVELGAIAGGMVMEGILRWANGRTRRRSLQQVIGERMDLILDGARRR